MTPENDTISRSEAIERINESRPLCYRCMALEMMKAHVGAEAAAAVFEVVDISEAQIKAILEECPLVALTIPDDSGKTEKAPPCTYAEDFFKKFPKCKKAPKGFPAFECRRLIYDGDYCKEHKEYKEYDCDACWNEPIT